MKLWYVIKVVSQNSWAKRIFKQILLEQLVCYLGKKDKIGFTPHVILKNKFQMDQEYVYKNKTTQILF